MLAKDMPIYKMTFDFVCHFEKVLEQMPKFHRYALGDAILKAALSMFEYIERHNRAYGDAATRVACLNGYLVKLNTIETYIRIAVQVCAISRKQQAVLNQYTVQLGRQATALKNSSAGENVQVHGFA